MIKDQRIIRNCRRNHPGSLPHEHQQMENSKELRGGQLGRHVDCCQAMKLIGYVSWSKSWPTSSLSTAPLLSSASETSEIVRHVFRVAVEVRRCRYSFYILMTGQEVESCRERVLQGSLLRLARSLRAPLESSTELSRTVHLRGYVSSV